MKTILAAVSALVASALVKQAQAAGAWSLVSTTSLGNGLNNVGFFDDGVTGIVAVGDGIGYNIRRTTDGGNSWTNVPNADGYIFGLNGAVAHGIAAVACGDLATQVSVNEGVYFNSSFGGGPGGAVIVRNYYTASEGFVQVGVLNDNTNGLSISNDLGLTWTSKDASAALNESGAVGAACQPNGLFYVVGADAPQAVYASTPKEGKKVTRVHKVTRNGRIAIRYYEDGTAETLIADPALTDAKALGDPFRAQLAKSTDGGSTFTIVETIRNKFEWQAIDCSDAAGMNCCAVGEALSGAHAGAYIRCTTDGWATSNLTHNDTTSGASLIDIRATTIPSEFWAVGGYVTDSALTAVWWHSLDGGKTWNADTTMANYYVPAINCNNGHCFSAVIDGNENSFIARLAPTV